MTHKPDTPVLERHRRMAANHLLPGMTWPQYVKRWVFTGDREDLCGTFLALPSYALFAATVERDARAEGKVEAMARVVREARTACIDAGTYGAVGGDELEPLQAAIDALDALVIPDAIRALLPEPPRGEGES